MALRDINNRSDILPGYKLDVIIKDTKHNSFHAVKEFFDLVSKPPKKYLIYGPIQSANCEAVAPITKYWNLITFSPSATSMKLANKKTYSNFFRTSISDFSYNPARIAVMKHFNWTRIGLISQVTDLFTYAAKDLEKLASREDIQVVSSESFTDDPTFTISQLKEKDVRIIVLNAYPAQILQVLCSAYLYKLYGAQYVWFLPGWFFENWIFDNYRPKTFNYNCTMAQLLEVADYYIAFKGVTLPRLSEPRLAGYTAEGFNKEYINFGDKIHLSGSYTYAYDAAWTIALALNRTREILQRNYSRSLDDFNYNDSTTMNILQRAINDVQFIGVSGKIVFQDGNRLGNVRIMQYQRKVYINYTVTVGFYDVFEKKLFFSNYKNKITFKGNYTPVDHAKRIIRRLSVGKEIFAIFATLSSLGTLLSLFMITFNVTYRSVRQVKITSPRVNVMLLLGCVLCYLSVILLGLDWNLISSKTFIASCTAAVWLLSIGFTLGFGSLFWKTWRVYAIYKSKSPKRKIIRDIHILPRLAVLLVIDIIILSLWQIIDPMRTIENSILSKHTSSIGDYEITSITMVCQSVNMPIWLGVIYGYKFVLMIFGAFLAWETRHVNIQEINDSKLIGLSIYNVALLCTVGVILYQFTTAEPSTSYSIVSSFIIFCNTVTICIIFIPMIRNVKEGRDVTSFYANRTNKVRSNTKEGINGTINTVDVTTYKREIEQQNEIVYKLKQFILANNINVQESEEIRSLFST
ncbi:uncharacterized protein TRIADDRAFT_59025 [Trichoplax adhaerens]|uniref:G-protein coupled receptors family 3 profile domain-containing protein n=1 Tax=Trichoplax adhaerens TaxID=10228 RepID=B3S4B6_TRIAD|nr:hypothetical protein TRIADDRAFT_59025 [Trichoplax adhaerens]EDV22611.1 hypothetical protein TRIADDRAFT_59025 [Trichoplax adhaerens]|eukprot:XP_002115155.1 hypothetical protein TRIADDRAFT_59025 [Trichoplax adhaerens]